MSKRRGSYKKFAEDRDFSGDKVTPSYIPFAKNLSALMEAQNITNYALKEALGLNSSSSITNYRNAHQFPSDPEQLIKLATALGTSVDALIGNTEDAYLCENDLLHFSDRLHLSPTAISHILSLSIGSNQSISGIDMLLSDKRIIKLSASIKAISDKVDRAAREAAKTPTMPNRLYEQWKEVIYGKVYVAVREFESMLEDMIEAGLNKHIHTEQEADNGTEE